MKLFDVRSVLTAALLAMLSACGGGGQPPAAASPVALSTTSAQRNIQSPIPGSNDGGAVMVDGLAEAYRNDAQQRGSDYAKVQPAYPRVPASALMLALAPPAETYGTGAQQVVQSNTSTQ